MKNRFKGIAAIALMVVMLMSSGIVADAEGTTTLYLSDNSPSVGETFQLKVEGSESSAITIKYNASVLSVEKCDAPGYSTDGNTVSFSAKVGIVTFKVKDTGSSSFIVSSDKLEGSSTKIDVAGSSSSTDSQTSSDSQTGSENTDKKEESSSKSTSSGEPDFVINSTNYVLSERFSDDEIPAGFEKQRMEIHEHTYRVLYGEPFTLIYLKEASNLNAKGKFFIYDKDNDKATPFITLSGDDRYVILLDTDELPLDNMIASTIVVNETEVPVYVINDYEGLAFFYGHDMEIGDNWYVYDINAGTYDIADMGQYAPQEEETTVVEQKDDMVFGIINKRYLFAIIAFLAVVIAIIIVNVILKRKDLLDDEDEDEDDDEDDEDDEDDDESEDDVQQTNDEIVEYVNKVSDTQVLKPYAEDDDEEEFAFWEDEKTIRKAKKAKAKAAKKAMKKRKQIEDGEEGLVSDVSEAAEGAESSEQGEDYKYDKKEVESAKKIDIMDLNNL